MQLGFNLSNGVTDTLETSTILIYSDEYMSLYTQRYRHDVEMIKLLIERIGAGSSGKLNQVT